MKKFRWIALLVVLCLALTAVFAACKDPEDGKGPHRVPTPSGDYGYTWDYDDEYSENSAILYNNALGEFYMYYNFAKEADRTLSERYALMAIAEAKLYESGVLLPTSSNGGGYAVSRVANGTVSSVLWGTDSSRLHTAIVANQPISITDRNAMRDKRNEGISSGMEGAEYLAWIRQYLADNGYTTKNTYNSSYASDPETFDIHATYRTADSDVIVNTYDGLVQYDVMNVMQPALATSIPTAVQSSQEINPLTDATENTVTYTFTIRQGVKWVDSQGREVANLTAQDFATGFQHMLDANDYTDLGYLVAGVVVGAYEYLEGTADFSDVGVTVDTTANTVTYQVYESAEVYFLSMLTYNTFAPLSKTFFESKGGTLGEYDPSIDYGSSADNIAYCGPYLISEHTPESIIRFVKNDSWWNSNTTNARNVDEITWSFNDGTDANKSYTEFKSGAIDGCGLSTATLQSAKTDMLPGDTESIFAKYSYKSSMDATAFCMFFNINREAYSNFNDPSVGVSQKTSDQKDEAYVALQNVNFRRALAASIDRVTYQAQVYGNDVAENTVNNMYTPGNFITLPEDIIISINGTDVTYPKGTYYGKIVQDQLDADGVEITVWKEVDGEYKHTGFDGWYNPEYAKAQLEIAIAELAEEGITISAANPIVIDYIYVSTETNYVARAQALKQGIESVLEGKVIVNLVPVSGYYPWYYAGYFANDGSECNYDMYDCSGWGPDYGDPASYLDTFLPDYSGSMTQMLGIF